MTNRLLAALVLAATAGCARSAYEQHDGSVDLMDPGASAEMRLADGTAIGTLRLTERAAGGIRITGSLLRIAAGPHGIHVHAVGRCDAPSFESAGGHFNPLALEHGLENPRGPHAGDAPNIAADAQSRASVDLVVLHASLKTGPANILDADGAAVVVHAQLDDQRTNPSGNSGDRIACGVVRR